MSEETPAFLLLMLISDELNSKQVPLHLYVTVGYTEEFAKLQLLDSIDLNLEGEPRRCFVASVEPAPGAVAAGCVCFTVDGQPYDPAKVLAERLSRFKADVKFITSLMDGPAWKPTDQDFMAAMIVAEQCLD